MGTATQKTWLEKQTDLVQQEVLAWEDSGKYTLDEMCAMLREKHELTVPASTLHHSLKQFAKEIGKREKLAMEIYRKRRKFFDENPDADPRVLAEHAITFDLLLDPKEKIDREKLLYLAQGEAHIKLRERELAVKEAANHLKEQHLELERKRVGLLELRIESAKRRMEEATDEAKGKIGSGQQLTLEDINRIRERVYGLPETAAGPAT